MTRRGYVAALFSAIAFSVATLPVLSPVYPPRGTHLPWLNQYAPKGGEHAADEEGGNGSRPTIRPKSVTRSGVQPQSDGPRRPNAAGGSLPAVPAPAAKGVSDAITSATAPMGDALDATKRAMGAAWGPSSCAADEAQGSAATAAIVATPSVAPTLPIVVPTVATRDAYCAAAEVKGWYEHPSRRPKISLRADPKTWGYCSCSSYGRVMIFKCPADSYTWPEPPADWSIGTPCGMVFIQNYAQPEGVIDRFFWRLNGHYVKRQSPGFCR